MSFIAGLIVATATIKTGKFVMFNYFRNKKIKNSLALLTLVITMQPTVSLYADTISDAGRAGQTLGIEAYGKGNTSFPLPSYNSTTGDLAYGASSNSTNLNINEFYPQTSDKNTRPDSYYSSATVDIEYLKSNYNNPSAIQTIGQGVRQSQYTASSSANGNTWSGAIDANIYNLALGASGKKAIYEGQVSLMKIDAQNAQAGTTYQSIINSVSDACDRTSTITKVTKTKRIPSYESCTIPLTPSASCTINHNYTISTYAVDLYAAKADSITTNSEQANFSFNLATGVIAGNDDSQGSGLISNIDYHGKQTEIQAAFAAGKAVEIKLSGNTYWSGYTNTETNSTRTFEKVGNSVINSIVTEVDNAATAKHLTSKITVVVAFLENSSWTQTTDSCFQTVAMIKSGACSQGSISGEQICKTVSGANSGISFEICESGNIANAMIDPSFGSIVTPASTSITVSNAVCSATSNDTCYTDAQGVQQCPSSSGSIETCTALLAEKPSCVFIDETCVSFSSIGGACTLKQKNYDCGTNVSYEEPVASVAASCSPVVRCGGQDCADFIPETASSFGKVSALLDSVNMMANDMNCASNDPSSCRVFAGSKSTCKQAVGGLQDCCKKPNSGPGPNVIDYVTMLASAGSFDNKMKDLENSKGGTPQDSAYRKMSDPANASFTELSAPFSNGWDSATQGYGANSNASSSTSSSRNEVKEAASAAFSIYAQSKLGDMAKDFLFNNSVTTGIMNSSIGSLAGTLFTAYSIYTTTVLIVQLMWPCTQEEIKLAGAKKINTTKKVGSYCHLESFGLCVESREQYCVYNSPLSRIITEQIKMQQGTNYGNVSCNCSVSFLGACIKKDCSWNANCGGLSIAEVASVDWKAIDLSEWTATLVQANLYKVPDSLNVNSLTGGTNVASGLNGQRNNVIDRTKERLTNGNVSTTTSTTIRDSGVKNNTLPLYKSGQE